MMIVRAAILSIVFVTTASAETESERFYQSIRAAGVVSRTLNAK